jgi:hypothetical protein
VLIKMKDEIDEPTEKLQEAPSLAKQESRPIDASGSRFAF